MHVPRWNGGRAVTLRKVVVEPEQFSEDGQNAEHYVQVVPAFGRLPPSSAFFAVLGLGGVHLSPLSTWLRLERFPDVGKL